MDRVYISANLLAVERSRSESRSSAAAPPSGFAADVLANVLARMRPQGSDGTSSMGIVLAAVGVVAVLVILAVGLVAFHGKPALETTDSEAAAVASKNLPAKPGAQQPFLPPLPPQPIQPVALPRAATPPAAATARAWTFWASAGVNPTAGAPAGQQQTGAALWPEVWQLPDSASSTDELRTSLTDADAGLKVSLIAAAADFPAASDISVVPEVEPTTRPPGMADPIASLRLDGSDLVFSWAQLQRDARLTSQLANCLLEISDGKRKRVVQLREPLRAEPIAIDLSSDKQQVEIPLPNPPRASALQLEITELIGFSSEATFRGGMRNTGTPAAPNMALMSATAPGSALPSGMTPGMGMSAFAGMPVGGKVIVEFPSIPGLEIQVGIKQESGKVVVSVDPMFKEDGKDGELSLRRIAQIEEDAKKPLPNAQRDLDSAERSLKLWSDKLKESNANEPPSTSRRFPAWKLKHMEATRNAASFERGVADLNARIDKSKSRLDAAAKLRAFLKDSNKQATIHYVVYSECGETDLLLIDGRGR